MADAPLKPAHARFVSAYIANGRNATKAAIEAGFSEATARKRGPLLLQREDVKQAVAAASKEIIDQGIYDQAAAVAQLELLIQESREKNQLSAAVKAAEVKARICGLMIDRVDLRAVAGFQLVVSGIDFAKRDGAEPEPEEDFSNLIDKDEP